MPQPIPESKPELAETHVLIQAGQIALRFRGCAVEEHAEELMPIMRFSIENARRLRELIDLAIIAIEKSA